MKPGTRGRRQDPAAGGDEKSSRNRMPADLSNEARSAKLEARRAKAEREIAAARDGGLTGVVDEELEFFDTVGVESQHAIDAFSFAGVRVRH